ncbi:FabD/lysophospholipase-like protein [Calocera viscosa TUFC12733]|uniref:Lysophospholipase n=1 Tax=Calocera viscosa (strain TUFC12733) TaxID=1330018 RepID=A0A167JAJ5_CALVF|nr:FabD/lysophospholipase-like protein [Calocera viscosa TUFC12733]
MIFSALTTLSLAALLAPSSAQSNLTVPSGYAPTYSACPTNVTWLRGAQNLSDAEHAWVQGRKVVVADALGSFLGALNWTGFNVTEYVRLIKGDLDNVPVVSLALSGGGDVAAFTGIGIVQAFDSRYPPALSQRTGGLLQSLTYFAGLSGGSWPVVSYSVSSFPTSSALITAWDPEIDPYYRGDNASAINDYEEVIFEQIGEKAEAGFPVSLADYLGRALSSETIPGPGYGVNVTWSGVASLPAFKNFSIPFPIVENVVVDPNSPSYAGVLIPQANSTIIEATPFEWGAWQGDRIGFTPTKYLGTILAGGSPVNTSTCVTGFDNAGFILASASNAWNLWYLNDISNGTEGNFAKRSLSISSDKAEEHALSKRASFAFPISTIEGLAGVFNQSFNLTLGEILTAPYFNPWLGVGGDNATFLQLVDGSEAGQTIPLAGIMQPARKPDLIIAYDASQETAYGWQNGTNLIDSYTWAVQHGIPFPKIPTAVTILNRNYSTRPTFFGCAHKDVPVVLYLSNAPYSTYTNFSFIEDALPPQQVQEVLLNSFNIVSQGNGTLNSDFPECLGCAVIQRSIERLGWNTTAQCQACFSKYCWDEVDDTKLNPGLNPFNPEMSLPPTTFAVWNQTHNYTSPKLLPS